MKPIKHETIPSRFEFITWRDENNIKHRHIAEIREGRKLGGIALIAFETFNREGVTTGQIFLISAEQVISRKQMVQSFRYGTHRVANA